ncbi:YhgE/Pip family protein [Virgibacillus oceani]
MRNIWSIFKQDLKNIRRVPFVGILLIGLAILPALYAWFNLGASWDPYSNTEGIQIAVVNEDAGAEIEDEYINIGDQLVENLADNREMGWEFTSRQEAEDGVKHGDYYAGIYIDHAFSESLAQVIHGEPRKAEVTYQVNEKINAIAPKMTSAGASAIVTNINEQFVQETTKVLFEEFDRLGIRLEEELPTMRRIKQVIYELDEHLPEINRYAETLIEVEENWEEIDSSVEQFLALEDYFPQIHSGAELILRLKEQFPVINQLGDEVLKLEQSIPEMEQAAEDLNSIAERFAEVANRLEWGLENTQLAHNNINNIQERIPSLVEKRDKAGEYVETLREFVQEVEGSVDSVNEIFLQQLYVMNQTASAVDQTLAMIENEESVEGMASVFRQLNDQLASNINVLENTIDMYGILYGATKDENVLAIIDRLTELQNVLESLQQEVEQLIGHLEHEELNTEQIETVRQKAHKAEKSSSHFANLLEGEWAENVDDAYAGLLDNLPESVSEIGDAYVELDEIGEVLEQAEQVVIAGEETIKELLNTLPDVEARVTELVQKTQEELPDVIDIIKRVADFTRDDLPVIESRVSHVAKMIKDDLPGVEQKYVKVAEILKDQVPEVKASLSELNNFSREHLPDLEETIHKTVDRISVIEDGDRITKLISVLRNDLDEESDFFASPVNLKEESLFHIPNYGSANAPFYTVLSLWVGALLLSNLISTNLHPEDMRKSYTLRQVYFGKMILFLIVAVLQGIIVSVGNLQLLGIYAAHPFLSILFSVIIAVIFMTIVYTLVSILGNLGKALAIVLLVLQLSSSGGTFPIDVAPSFFQAIHPFMPFPYAIDLLREALGGIISSLVWKNIVFLLVFWILALIIGQLLKPILTERIEKTYQKSKASRLID